DRVEHGRFLAAVHACFGRLVTAGVDPSAFTVAEMAADVEDVRSALGIPSWVLLTYGTASRIALEAVRQDSSHITGLLLDSPETPSMDPRAVAMDTGERISDVLAACDRDAACALAYPDPTTLWQRAVARLVDHPVNAQIPISSSDRRTMGVRFDPGLLI